MEKCVGPPFFSSCSSFFVALPGTVTVSGVPEARYSTAPPLALPGVWPAIRKSFNFKESLQPQKKEERHRISMGQRRERKKHA